jgi:signal transduction histidine kinase
MRICVWVPDRVLRRALEDLLRAHGHDVVPGEVCRSGCGLLILQDRMVRRPPRGTPVLYLRPPAGARAAPDPAAALEDALETKGVAIWDAPLDPACLVAVLGGDRRGARSGEREPAAPRLVSAPDPWLLVEPTGGRVLWANLPAETLLDFPEQASRPLVTSLDRIARIVPAVLHEREGARRVEGLDRPRVAIWWTGPAGERVLGLIERPPAEGGLAERRENPLEEMGRMAATMAHEIRNPLASVAGALELLEEEDDPIERKDIAQMARKRLLQMRALLDDTLRLSRPIDKEPEAVDANAAIESAVSLLRANPKASAVEIAVVLDEGQVDVRSHAEPLRQALANLLLNAAEAQAWAGRIEVSLRREGERAVIRVRDEGPGIPPERHEDVFRPFYTTKSGGTGLGLAYVRGVADAAGGSIALEDAERGACFRLTLPLASLA